MVGSESGGAMDTRDRPWLAAYPKDVPTSIEPVPSENAYSLLAGAASRHPDRPAIAWFGRHLSYRALEAETARFAGVLSSHGIGPRDRVSLILPNCPQYVIAYYATLRIGAVVVGNNPLYTVRELAHQLADAGPSIVVVLDSLYPSLEAVRQEVALPTVIVTRITDYMGFPKRQLAPLKLKKEATAGGHPWPPVPRDADVTWWARAMKAAPEPPPVAAVDAARDPAAFVYTGGTTGVAKGAMLSHRNILANAMQCGAWFTGTEDGAESIMCVLPFFHCYGATVGLHLGILMAAKLVLLPRFELEGLLKEIEKERPTLFPGVPRLYIAINEATTVGHHDLSSIKYCLSGAGALPLAVAQRFRALTGATLVEGYGLTEASPVAIANPLDGSAREGCIGIPVPDTDAKLVDLADPTRSVATGEQGELCIRGPQVMIGYWNRADETADVIRDGWLHTGDIAVMESDGFFRIVDRLKDMIKVSGFNVYPTEVEQVLYRHPDVLKACVIGIPDGQGGEMVKAFIVLRPGSSATTAEIGAWCRDPSTGLAGFRVPKAIEFRGELPETLVGKVLRRVLVEEERRRAASPAS